MFDSLKPFLMNIIRISGSVCTTCGLILLMRDAGTPYAAALLSAGLFFLNWNNWDGE